ncbi:hypothetical protein SAMN04489841_1142 [Natrinema salaciae]|uniref:Uncharacterized protein n=1 Tax=Natrinema salaciae TaxID=1186196 RepID=A0A1H9CSE1_9EURY|nr:hypothetical protein SAMN04489841_1142 [Natrinema salaciae]
MVEQTILRAVSYGTEQFVNDFTLLIYVGMIAIFIAVFASIIRSVV